MEKEENVIDCEALFNKRRAKVREGYEDLNPRLRSVDQTYSPNGMMNYSVSVEPAKILPFRPSNRR